MIQRLAFIGSAKLETVGSGFLLELSGNFVSSVDWDLEDLVH